MQFTVDTHHTADGVLVDTRVYPHFWDCYGNIFGILSIHTARYINNHRSSGFRSNH